jgi:Putative zinc dependent peptidase (DUF5700)
VPAQESTIRLVTDQADAMLAILAKRESSQPIDADDWRRLFDSEGYRRLAAREASMKVPISEADFQEFAMSDALLQDAGELRKSLSLYAEIDLESVIARTTAYLPPEATLHGIIYPAIKPKPNSFVYEMDTDPAIFLAIKPGLGAAKLENTLIHELHHWGLASLQLEGVIEDAGGHILPLQAAKNVLTVFGEGFAMLAAAGGTDMHPHHTSPLEDRERWDRSMCDFDKDLKLLDQFLLDVLDGTFATEQELIEGVMAFLGIQGPWYTVGWKMAQCVEAARGRSALLTCMRDPRQLLRVFNEVPQELHRGSDVHPVLWSDELLERLGSE